MARALPVLASLCLAQAPVARVPIQAELIRSIDAGRAHQGDTIYAKVNLLWDNPLCKLREGAILKGRIVAQTARSKTAKSSSVAVSFESGQCGGRDMKPLTLAVAALLAPDPNRSLYKDQESQPLDEAPGLGLGQEGTGSPMRSMLAAASTVMLEPPRAKKPQLVMPGQVIGIRNVTLVIGLGPEGSSVLSSEKQNVRLEAGTRLVLVPRATPLPQAEETAPDSRPRQPSLADAPAGADNAEEAALEEADACIPPTCSRELSTSEPETSPASPEFKMQIGQLGFTPFADQEMYELDHAAAISYLGPNQLLFTFNPHTLIPRSADDMSAPKLHMVRGVLIDLQGGKVIRTVDWRIYDGRQYLWPIGRDAVLVHVGTELRLYGPDLKLQRRLPLNGPLAFVAVAPSASYLAVGVVHERHTDTIHRELAEAENRDPEEDIEVQVLGSDFHAVSTVVRSSRSVTPVLTDNGEIRVPTIGKNRWRIAEFTWAGERRVLKQVESSCRPQVTSLPASLLFVTGCDRLGDGKWYSIIREDGRLVLRGSTPSTEQGHSASGIADGGLFAVGIGVLSKPLTVSSAFRSSDLKHLRVTVYRGENGKKISAVTISDPLPMVQTFALSPDGGHLAILQNEQIVLYALPQLTKSTSN